VGIYADITRLSEETLRDLEAGRAPRGEVGFDPGDLSPEDAFEAYNDWLLEEPGFFGPQVFAEPEKIDPERVRWLDLHTQFDMILYQLSGVYRREGGSAYHDEVDDPLAGVVAGTFTLDIPLDTDPSFPYRGAWPEEVADLSRRLAQVSEDEFLRVHRTEPPPVGSSETRPYRFVDLSDPRWRESYRHALHNLKAFYAVAAREGQAMLYSVG
jgi:hypothetical protein